MLVSKGSQDSHAIVLSAKSTDAKTKEWNVKNSSAIPCEKIVQSCDANCRKCIAKRPGFYVEVEGGPGDRRWAEGGWNGMESLNLIVFVRHSNFIIWSTLASDLFVKTTWDNAIQEQILGLNEKGIS